MKCFFLLTPIYIVPATKQSFRRMFCLDTVDSEIFARFIFAKSFKRHTSDVKNPRLRQDLPISIKDRVILPFREGFIFTKLVRSFAKIKSSRKFPNLQ